MLLKTLLITAVNWGMVATAASATMPAARAYSTRSCPFVSFHSRPINSFTDASFWHLEAVGSTLVLGRKFGSGGTNRYSRQILEANFSKSLHSGTERREILPSKAGLFLVFFYYNRLKVFSFKNLAAIETFDVVYAIAPGDDLGAGMITGGLHKRSTL